MGRLRNGQARSTRYRRSSPRQSARSLHHNYQLDANRREHQRFECDQTSRQPRVRSVTMIRSRNLSAYAVASALWFFSSAAEAQSALSVRAKAAAAVVDSGDAVAAAAKDYHVSGVARTVVQGDFVTFPFGHAQPTLTCGVLRACVI